MAITRSQIQLGANVYGNSTDTLVTEAPLPSLPRTIVTAETPMALVWPQKDFGPKPPPIKLTMFIPEASYPVFAADVQDSVAGERKLQFWMAGEQVYVYVKTGTVDPQRFGTGLAARQYLVTVEFTPTRTPIYRYSDNTIMLGGS